MVFSPLVVVALSLFTLAIVEAAVTLQPPVKLKWQYYKRNTTCPEAEGCDASILLDGPNSEKTAPQNRGLGGFALIDKIKEVLEERCPGVVSCADILNLATRDAVHLAGAPSYPLYTGRRDGMTSSAASVDLPSPSIPLSEALAYFKSKGLDVLDFATLLETFYKRVLSYKSVLGVDQQLLFSNDTLEITQEFAAGFEDLRKSFALSMNRMGNINVLTGNAGEIRRNCSVVNKK
ncbi:hypothetical protein GH714_005317 [Hevea brasiliensis]|uniref:peroxidase n=1 Tax=Hevea brasiliensis TaxID=3981 RepID=A0A6A6NBM4_HEVBR|nr:hypothetical protein GH714_005317 [Hevea brasiliensis]